MKVYSLISIIPLALLTVSFSSAQNAKEAEMVLTTDIQKIRFATFENSDRLVWAPLKEGVNIFGTTDRYQWDRVPESLRGVRFLVLPHHSGVLKFEVESGGIVYLATSTRWYESGNSSGGWKDEVLLEKDLRRKGWRRLSRLKELSNNDTGEMAVFYRHCEAGEKHSIRTEKYAAPMLLIK